jgi:hypothetical protein
MGGGKTFGLNFKSNLAPSENFYWKIINISLDGYICLGLLIVYSPNAGIFRLFGLVQTSSTSSRARFQCLSKATKYAMQYPRMSWLCRVQTLILHRFSLHFLRNSNGPTTRSILVNTFLSIRFFLLGMGTVIKSIKNKN